MVAHLAGRLSSLMPAPCKKLTRDIMVSPGLIWCYCAEEARKLDSHSHLYRSLLRQTVAPIRT